ncbi:PLP-dependent aminotransferase family protein [Streptomyces sp. NPDC060048]|uniref:aminotransferase-like domain-containing protein n=1 Tax=unclassified Streptomyces TaxID=2593676 RepID=UPI003682B037
MRSLPASVPATPVPPAPGDTDTDTDTDGDLDIDLELGRLHRSLTDPVSESMTFLNEIASRYPDAISFAAGRPFEGFFDVDQIHRYLRTYERHLREQQHLSREEAARTLFQYGRTKGVIHDLIAENLRTDEGIEADPEALVVTVGCQEALFLVLRALRGDERDVVLAVSPTYVGLTGAASLIDLPVLPVRGGPRGVDLADLASVVQRARREGLRPRACYLVPDFANPMGVSLDLETRHRLLDLARREDLLLIEDNPYGLFTATGTRIPTLKSLDRHRRVLYLGSYAKSALPGARVGFVVADQRVADAAGGVSLLADQLAKIKSMLTVNTSPIAQAVIAGKLLACGYSLAQANERERELYRANRRRILAGLMRHFPPGRGSGVRWNVPKGGFFLVLDVPFPADDELLAHSASEHGVLWTPMRHFFDAPETARRLRLSYSQLTPDRIDEGLRRLAAMVTERSSRSGPPLSAGSEGQGQRPVRDEEEEEGSPHA